MSNLPNPWFEIGQKQVLDNLVKELATVTPKPKKVRKPKKHK